MGQWVHSHYNNADEYLVSGWPWVKTGILTKSTGPGNNIIKLEFPAVVRFFTIHNVSDTSSMIHVAFSNSPGDNTSIPPLRPTGFYSTDKFFLVGTGETTPALEIKCKEIYLRAPDDDAKYSVIAGYTNVPSSTFPDLAKYRDVFTGV